MPWHFYLAIKQIFPSGRKLPPIAYFASMIGVALGVMLLAVVISVMEGFGDIYREKIIETNGHFRIESGHIIHNADELTAQLQAMPEVEAAAPYARGVVMLQYRNRPAFPYIMGIDPEAQRIVPFDKFLQQGEMESLDDETVFLSYSLSRSIGGTDVGSTVELFTPLMLEKMKQDEALLPREVEVGGLYTTGWSDFDSNTMICSLRAMQDLYGLDDGVHGIAARLKPGADEDAVCAGLNSELLQPPLRAKPWHEQYEDFLWVLKLEKNMMFFILLWIIIVTAFVIAVAQLLSVAGKTREIGLLHALGGDAPRLAQAYCFQGLVVGLAGVALGNLAALLIIENRNFFIHRIAQWTGTEETLVKYYQFSNLPAHYALSDFAIIALCALALSALGGIIPAIRAARLNPAEALRNE